MDDGTANSNGGGRPMNAVRTRTVRCAAEWAAGAGALIGATACDHAASLLAQNGVSSMRETQLGWFLVGTSCAVVLIITVLVLVAAFRRRVPPSVSANPSDVLSVDRPREATENRWLTTFAIIIPALILTVSFLFTITTINAVGEPARMPAAGVVVTGHQWWWEVAYEDSAGQGFTTANEIHLPVGQPVRVKLQTGDVVHSFWVPQLAGKMDIIPGQNNETWLEARTAGTYSGPCGEYCGSQHANMRVTVVAESPESYAAWVAAQRQAAAAPADSQVALGETTFMHAGCAACHTIRGTPAGGAVGPDLTHLASRRTIGAGALPNTAANLQGWIADAQGIKPGNDMPRMAVSPRDMTALVAYLETLK